MSRPLTVIPYITENSINTILITLSHLTFAVPTRGMVQLSVPVNEAEGYSS